MRFGKRLAAVTQKSRANEPYISYKELKHIVSRVAALCGSKDGQEHSSGDEGFPTASSLQPADGTRQLPKNRREESTSASSSLGAGTLHPKVVAPQEEFFQLVGSDITAAKLFVQSTVSGLEAMLGEWQVAAIKAGLLFTPEQLAEISSQLPVKVGEEALMDWLHSLPPSAKTKEARRAVVEKYSNIAQVLNSLLQCIEVNLTAVRKIFKKFEKKVPVEFRIRQVLDYNAHHDLITPSMQHVLVTAVQMQRLIINTVAVQLGLNEEAMGVPISPVGPESLALLSWLRGPAGVDDVLGAAPAMQIDVYAKPAGSANVSGTLASALGTAPAAAPSGDAVEAAAGFVTTSAPAGAPTQAQQLQAGLITRPARGGDDDDDDDDGGEDDAAAAQAGNAAPHKPRRRGGRNNRKRRSSSQQGHQQGQPGQQQTQVQPQQPQQPPPKMQQHVQQQQARAKASSKGHHRMQLEAAPVALAAGLVTPQTTAAAAAVAAAASSAASGSSTKTAPAPGGGGGAGERRHQPPANSPMDHLQQPQLLLLQQQLQQFQQQQQQQPALLHLQQHLQQQFQQQLQLQQCLGQLQSNYGGKAAGKGTTSDGGAGSNQAARVDLLPMGTGPQPAMDPNLIAAMMPMLWPTPEQVLPTRDV